MHILYIITGSPVGSDQIFTKRQAMALRDRGLRVDMFFLPIWSDFQTLFRAYKKFRSTVNKTNPQIIHAQYGNLSGAICAFGTLRKMVITFRGSDLNPCLYANPIRVRLGHFLSQLAALRAARIICVSNELKGRLWWKKNSVRVIPSPINLELFQPFPQKIARKILDWNPNERVVLFNAGKTPIEKGHSIVKSAVKTAQSRYNDIRLEVLCGNVPPDYMPLYYNASDCLILASVWEGSPNVVKEALACNLPVITTKVGDVEERLNGVFPSKIVERDSYQMGNAIIDILSLNQRSNGRDKVAELSLSHTTKRLIAIYEQIIKKIRSKS